MARRTISQRIALDGGESIRRQLLALGQAGEKAFSRMQAAAAKLKGPGAAFARNMDAVRERFDNLDKQLARFSRRARNTGLGLTATLTAPITLMGRSFLGAASQAAEANSAFDVLFRSSAEQVRGWADDVADSMGRGQQTIRDQAAAFQLLFSQVTEGSNSAASRFKTFGDNVPANMQKVSAEAVDLSKKFTVLAQDLASFYNVSEEVAIQKLTSGLAGSAEPLRAFGIFLNENAVQAEGLKMGLKGLNDELTDQEKVLVRAKLILEQTKQAQGDATRTAASYENQLKKLQGQWKDLSIELGKVMIPVAKEVIAVLGDIIKTIRDMDPEMQRTIVVIAGLAATVGPLLIGLATVVGTVSFAIWGMVGAFTAVTGGLLAVVPAITTVIASIAGLVAAVVGWPITFAIGIAAVALALYTFADEIVAVFTGAFDAVAAAASGAWSFIAAFTGPVWAAIEDDVGRLVDQMRGLFGGAADWIIDAFQSIGDAIGSVIDWAQRRLETLRALIRDVTGFSGGGAVAGFSGGGRVHGPGTATSDSIPARLSAGEFVIQARAVQHYGARLFAMLNSLSMPKGAAAFAGGGMVRAGPMLPGIVPAFAGGGMVTVPGGDGAGPYATINLALGGETFAGLMAPRDVADRLIRFAMSEEVKSAGRRPGWFGGGNR